MKFKVGDRVLAIDNIGKFKDWTEGVVSEVPPAAPGYRVRFPYGGNLYVKDSKSIKPLHSGGNHKIVITADGKTTLARLYDGDKVVKSKEAKCSPTDTFSFQTGAELAFKRLFENPVEKPEPPKADPAPEPKVEPVKLYCVKSFLNWLTKGKVYESVAGGISGSIDTDNGDRHTDWMLRKEGYLFPLVKRPAKVGEWVYCTENCGGFTKAGTIYSVVSVTSGGTVSFHDPSGYYHCTNALHLNLYLTLDGYQPEEKKPEYWSGKAVCINPDSSEFFTRGKVYKVTDGILTGDDGDAYNGLYDCVKTPGDLLTKFVPKFVEYKGEA